MGDKLISAKSRRWESKYYIIAFIILIASCTPDEGGYFIVAPGRNKTVAEYDNDRSACSHESKFEDCMSNRGNFIQHRNMAQPTQSADPAVNPQTTAPREELDMPPLRPF